MLNAFFFVAFEIVEKSEDKNKKHNTFPNISQDMCISTSFLLHKQIHFKINYLYLYAKIKNFTSQNKFVFFFFARYNVFMVFSFVVKKS